MSVLVKRCHVDTAVASKHDAKPLLMLLLLLLLLTFKTRSGLRPVAFIICNGPPDPDSFRDDMAPAV